MVGGEWGVGVGGGGEDGGEFNKTRPCFSSYSKIQVTIEL